MAKAAKAKRVFELAKELGVKSKAIVAKCEAEDVPGITNHMSTVKVGLEMTIRDWFGGEAAEDQHTSVETAERVDITKAKAKPRARKSARRKAGEAEGGGEEGGASTATLDRPTGEAGKAEAAPAPEGGEGGEQEPQPPQQAPAPGEQAQEKQAPRKKQAPAASAQPAPKAGEPSDQPEADPGAQPEVKADESAAQPAQPQAPEDQDQAQAPQEQPQAPAPPQPVQPAGQQNVPERPTEVKPAGELVEPTKAAMRGPKVIRIEKPEPVRAPGSRRGGGGGGRGRGEGEDANAVPDGSVPGITRTRGPSRGGGVRGPGGGPEESGGRGGRGGGGRGGGGGGRGNKRRSMNTRRGRSGDALPTGPAQFSQADMEELDARLKGASGFMKQRRRDLRKSERGGPVAVSAAVAGGKVEVTEPITIKALSSATGIKGVDVVKWLFRRGVMATINSAIDTEAAEEVALEYDIELEVKAQQTAQEKVEQEFEARESIDQRPRPPVVTVLGHVDHGKTSLLDKIRKADAAQHEHGGITQHVGAYRVTIDGTDEQQKTVVFLDTPGHAAFTSMRSRGAKMTDLVVLVIAADDGVMPQTVESINHARAAGVPIIVALNKIDTPQATEENIRRVYGQLAEHGLNPVEWGGETEVVKTSAEQGTGITELLETLDFQAQLLEIKADYGGAARGTVIEAEMQPGRGPVARVLVREGQIHVGDFIVIGRAYGRVRDMSDDHGRNVQEAGPATPLEISGIDNIPDAGDKFYITDTLKKAEDVASQYRETERQQQLATKTKVTLDNFSEQIKAGQVRELRVVLKADVQGSVDVLRESLEELGNDEVAVRVLHAAVGGITESDAVLADASDAIVVGFHVGVTPAVREIADQRDVDIRLYRVIYDITDDVKKALEGMLAPETRETETGQAQVKEVFRISKLGNIAGCLVTDGSVTTSAKMRVVREGVVVTDGRDIESLRRVKDEAREVQAGTECGIRIAGFDDLKAGDTLVCYRVEEVKRKLA